MQLATVVTAVVVTGPRCVAVRAAGARAAVLGAGAAAEEEEEEEASISSNKHRHPNLATPAVCGQSSKVKLDE